VEKSGWVEEGNECKGQWAMGSGLDGWMMMMDWMDGCCPAHRSGHAGGWQLLLVPAIDPPERASAQMSCGEPAGSMLIFGVADWSLSPGTVVA